jgi:hypothetical protein
LLSWRHWFVAYLTALAIAIAGMLEIGPTTSATNVEVELSPSGAAATALEVAGSIAEPDSSRALWVEQEVVGGALRHPARLPQAGHGRWLTPPSTGSPDTFSQHDYQARAPPPLI